MKLSLCGIGTRLICLAMAATLAVLPTLAEAAPESKRNLPIVRDAEIEALIGDYVRPLLKAAGLSRSGIEVVLVNSDDFNAFVLGRRIFVNTGAITMTETPNQLIGILAHEIGHLAGNHQERMREQIEHAQTIAIVAGLLGAGIVAAGAVSGSRNASQAGTGLLAGSGSAIQRGLLSYQRGEESIADRAAITYLDKTGQSGKGLLQTFDILDRQNLFANSRVNTYLLSHPMPEDRKAAIQEAAQRSRYYDRTDPPELVERHQLARAKVAAYSGGMTAVRRLFARDPRSLAALYGDAIATYLAGSTNGALTKMSALIASRPKNPWFEEMRGQILLDAGRGTEAAAAFRKAAQLDGSRSGLLKAEIGQALVTTGDPKEMSRAIEYIKAGLQSDPDNATAYQFLAMAYGHTGDIGRAELATADGYWHAGAFREAKVFAARAQQKLKPGSPPWRQAQDIITIPAH
ncbi:M48 family metalloprotease [Jiella sp. M17.18]|uniref:M48 family metalloprotease n=1 Tax=Jiella sp. M17.18 TaxID=3234247 RepID=UPI0034DE3E9D